MVARCNEYPRAHRAQRVGKRFQRFPVGRVAVKQVACKQHHVDPVLIHIICKPRQQFAALAAALARLLAAQRAKCAVQVKVRRMDDLHAHRSASLFLPMHFSAHIDPLHAHAEPRCVI